MNRLFVVSLMVCIPQDALAGQPFDIVLKHGRVVDGTGAPWYVADIGIRDGKIARIGRIDSKAGTTSIDATGLVVAPGFIDMMGQTAAPLLRDPNAAFNLLTQGITTINAGEGHSPAPLSDAEAKSEGWASMAEYFQLLDSKGLPVNVVQTVGHTQVRRMVLGEIDRRPTKDELIRMQAYVREAMEAGATGVSTALIYPPAVYASTDEIAALCRVAGEYGGRYYTHMRNEGDQLLEAIDEALQIGDEARTPVHIFHLKAAGRANWPKMDQAVAKIRAARARGQQVTADIYPYVNNGLGISAMVHPRHFAKGQGALRRQLGDAKLRKQIRDEIQNERGWENWFRHVGFDWDKVIVGSTPHKRYEKLTGQSLANIAQASKEDPWDTFFNLLESGAFVQPQSMTEANKMRLMREPFVSFCTDVGPDGGSRIVSHPRGYGAFPRLIGHYVHDLGVISLEQAVSRASAAAANAVMAHDRGRVAVGLAADLIVFDYESFIDRATFAEPTKPAQGMRYVVVNGELVFDGKFTGKRPGRVLRGPGFRDEHAPWNVKSGKIAPELAVFDNMMTQLMREHRIPGAALAVTDHGRLVVARGYGYADVAAKQPTTPQSLFRIASLSKPITSAAIMKLVEQKKLKLDDRVFDILKYEPQLEGDAKVDPRQAAITIRHLLQHRGGWDRAKSFDAMFRSVQFAKSLNVPPPAKPEHVIRNMLGLPLDFDPGERYAYSNYGYCLLGRVIEVKSGLSYERFVKQEVLAPLGIKAMRIGGTRLADRHHPQEVRYYDAGRGPSVFAADLDETVAAPYGAWYVEAMDSHGGWLASAEDLARFACAFEPGKTEILSEAAVKETHQRPPGLAGHDKDGKPTDTFYSLGWMNRVLKNGKVNHWHTGSLPGTATVLIRRHDHRNMIVLFNTRESPTGGHMGRVVDPQLHKALESVPVWPTKTDLFQRE
ncbi:MAG: serine hydrolase [Planctomycetota bacterium]|nr:serine hydrolase [Planctomycetota bacterium]